MTERASSHAGEGRPKGDLGRRITQRRVFGGGRSAIVNGLPSGPITYFAFGR